MDCIVLHTVYQTVLDFFVQSLSSVVVSRPVPLWGTWWKRAGQRDYNEAAILWRFRSCGRFPLSHWATTVAILLPSAEVCSPSKNGRFVAPTNHLNLEDYCEHPILVDWFWKPSRETEWTTYERGFLPILEVILNLPVLEDFSHPVFGTLFNEYSFLLLEESSHPVLELY